MLKPKRLSKGDKVAIVSLSRGMLGEEKFVHKYYIAKERLERDYNLEVIAMPNALKKMDYLDKHPEARAEDLMNAFADKEIKAVFNAIGGFDSVRLLPHIDFNVLKNNPKIFTGFSDTTSNHFMMYKAGLVSYYGMSVMNNIAEYVNINEYTQYFIDRILFNPMDTMDIPCSDFCSYETDKIWWSESNINNATPRFPNTGYEILQGSGIVEGELLGGCIDVFLALLGTELFPSVDKWRGKIMLIETSEGNMSELMLSKLLRNFYIQGILDVISGIVVGKPAFKDKYDSYKDVYRRVVAFEANRPDLPILYNANVGHSYPIGIFPLGLKYQINCEQKTFKLLEPATL